MPDTPRRRLTDAPGDDVPQTQELRLIAVEAAGAAAKLVSDAAAAEARVIQAATMAAHTLAESTRAAQTLDLAYIKRDLEEIKERLDSRFVSVEAFEPIRKLVHGLVALVLMAVVGGLLTLVIRR